jgi:hypothetical protein
VNDYHILSGIQYEQCVIDEIVNNGSIVVVFNYYNDFAAFNHKNGVPYSVMVAKESLL